MAFYTWGNSDVIPSTVINAAMLEGVRAFSVHDAFGTYDDYFGT